MRLLLVEDDPNDEALTIRALRAVSADLDIVIAHDGVEAIALLETMANRPDLILTDLKMPRLDGPDLVRECRKRDALSSIVAVVYSSGCEPSDIQRSEDAGCDHFLCKPIDYDDLVS